MIVRKTFRAMGCQIQALMDSDRPNPDRLERVPEWFEAWENCLSRFRPDSELSQLNQHTGHEIKVSQVLWEVFHLSLEMAQKSDGLVTPFVLDALEMAGYVQSFDVLAGSTVEHTIMQEPIPQANMPFIGKDELTRSITLPLDMRLDFGGVAKGWAAHTAMLKLKLYAPTLVDAGGDISISGLRFGGESWPVGISDPMNQGSQLVLLKLGKCGVATSGIDYRRWRQGESWKHHIIDPRTGVSADTDVISATVIASNVMHAEMASKLVVILGEAEGLDWVEHHKGYECLIVGKSGEVTYSSGFHQYVWE